MLAELKYQVCREEDETDVNEETEWGTPEAPRRELLR